MSHHKATNQLVGARKEEAYLVQTAIPIIPPQLQQSLRGEINQQVISIIKDLFQFIELVPNLMVQTRFLLSIQQHRAYGGNCALAGRGANFLRIASVAANAIFGRDLLKKKGSKGKGRKKACT
ncbi:unnamed protein product [Linum trigynum]|uniref:Uncharacterized protein n=1 Tax=Linum trigynum TaxID=586398 RepID=A0AAV2F5S3_9ROSI